MRVPLRPGPRLIAVLAAALVLSLACAVAMALAGWPGSGWVGAAMLFLVVIAIDAVAALAKSYTGTIVVKRVVPHALALGVVRVVELHVENRARTRRVIEVFDGFPSSFHAQGMPRTLSIARGAKAEAGYRITPMQRGAWQFGPVEAFVGSPLGLWQRRVFLGAPESVRVYPNFAAVARFALLATDHRLSRLGVRLRRRRGEGMEFHQLREYREGDSLRQIDWKATTRQRKLISREYQDERDQRLVFLLDCSRRMRARDGELSHFDQALNSLMLLAHVALRQGDSVGAMSFGGVERYFAPQKGAASLNLITNVLYDIEPQAVTGDFLEAAQRLMRKVPKRSLVVVITNLRDEDEDELDLAIRVLSAKHLVVLASLREDVLARLADTPVRTLDDALAVTATQQYLADRTRTFQRLLRRETIALDIEPARLPIALVNQYLEIKRSGRL